MTTNNKGDSLGDRMKTYESVTQSFVMRRTPVIIRIDGRAFHTFTKCLKHVDPTIAQTPFSDLMHQCMMYTTRKLVENIQNCVLGYTQSDEISLVLRDWDQHETQQWYGGNVQKIVSVSAAIATAAFNYVFNKDVRPATGFADLAQFDSRVYNVPHEEVTNYLIWRQQDASRNSVQMLGHFHFSQKQMHGKNNSEVQDMLMLQKGVNWNDLPVWMKRGSCVLRQTDNVNIDAVTRERVIEHEGIPVFTQDRDYVERLLLKV
jgi:tRNA(His) 5'-end guanylyltransferase